MKYVQFLKFNVQCSISEVSNLEKLHSYAWEHEVQEHGDQDNVANGLYGHKHTLDHVLEKRMQVYLVGNIIKDC